MMHTVTLHDGTVMPAIGLGTWKIPNDREVRVAVTSALEAGYRLIDTAKIYGNEEGIGKAVSESGVPREDLFITTKLWNSDQGYESALQAFDDSLERLGMDYVDLYLIHWPAIEERSEAWRALTELQRQGRVMAVGVSNYEVEHLKEIQDQSDVLPAVNQIEFHPFNYNEQRQLLEYCIRQDIVVEAYSPLARATDMHNPVIRDIAAGHAKSPAQVMLRWCIQHGTVPIPKSSDPERIRENFNVFDFELSSTEMKNIDDLSGVA